MFIIERRVGETVWIEDVEIRILKTGKTRVKLGITAHTDAKIVRGELLAKEKRHE